MNNGSDFNDDELVFFDEIPVLTDYIDSSLIYKHVELFKYSIYKLICKVDNNDYDCSLLKTNVCSTLNCIIVFFNIYKFVIFNYFDLINFLVSYFQ
jgi:hypothetical protein